MPTRTCANTKCCSQPTFNHSSAVSTRPASWSGAPYSAKPTWPWRSNFLMVSCLWKWFLFKSCGGGGGGGSEVDVGGGNDGVVVTVGGGGNGGGSCCSDGQGWW